MFYCVNTVIVLYKKYKTMVLYAAYKTMVLYAAYKTMVLYNAYKTIILYAAYNGKMMAGNANEREKNRKNIVEKKTQNLNCLLWRFTN